MPMSPSPNPFRIDGEFTIYRAAELADALKAALAGLPPQAPFEIDLGGVTEMDSAGVQLLMSARRSAADGGRTLRVAARSPAVAEVFRTLQLDAQFGDAVAPAH
jgi:anti-sigma B factor antagonist